MNKILIGILTVLVWTSVQADDLKVADDFESGDLVSADTFNQIFDTLEKINRTVKDSDLVGVWSCTSIHTGSSGFDATGWTQKGFIYELTGAQLNMTASSAATSLESAYSFSTSNPTPFYRQTTNSSDTGTYILYKGMLILKRDGNINIEPMKVEIISDTRVTFTPLGDGANTPEFVVCDSAAAVPAAPISPTVTNGKTSLNLAWTDASSDETGFKIYRKLSSESEAELVATQTAVTYSDTDLTEGQTAYYHVTAYNDNGESSKSKAVSATLDNTAPTVVAVTPSTSEKILRPTAGWSDTGDQYKTTFTFQFSEPVRVICEADPTETMQIACSGNNANFTVKAELIDSQTGSVTSSSGFYLQTQPTLYYLKSSWTIGPLSWESDQYSGTNDRNWDLVGDKLRLTLRGVRIQDENGIFISDDTLSWTYDLKTN